MLNFHIFLPDTLSKKCQSLNQIEQLFIKYNFWSNFDTFLHWTLNMKTTLTIFEVEHSTIVFQPSNRMSYCFGASISDKNLFYDLTATIMYYAYSSIHPECPRVKYNDMCRLIWFFSILFTFDLFFIDLKIDQKLRAYFWSHSPIR